MSADNRRSVEHRGRRSPAAVSMPAPALFDPVPVEVRSSDERLTPPWLFDALGAVFDLDPAAATGGDYVPARARYTAADDGLARPWHGLVWCNPPYSRVEPWARRMVDHGTGLFLAPLSSNTYWCAELVAASAAVTPLPRMRFLGADHTARHVSFGVVMYALGAGAEVAARLPDTFVRAP